MVLSFFSLKDSQSVEGVSNSEVMEYVTRKFLELTEINAEHNKRQMRESAKLRQKVLEVFKPKGKAPCDSKAVDVDEAASNGVEPVMLDGRNLMDFPVCDGASSFGRLLCAKYFGSEEHCTLMFERLDCKVRRSGGRVPCDPAIEEEFTSMHT